ncbi:MAG: ATP-binding protein [Candidatus Limivicinus sp.]|nr:ATP-binding protein [Candidatus Limivicinus sp.]
MAFDGKLLARARIQLDLIRSDNQAEHQRRLSLVYARVPEIQRMDETMRRQMTELVRLTISHPVDLKERLAALEKDNLDIQMRRAELLVENGWPVEYLDDIYSCPKCRDSGVYEGGVCSCLEKLYNKELTKELGTLLQHGDESFERFDLNYYDAAPVGGVSPRETMTMVLGACRKFADNFPAVSANLLFQGGTGLGKTYLSACIARVVANKGYSVCYDSAAAALEAFEVQKFSRDPETSEAANARVRRMLDCDLMILDDLGTEMISSISTSALYTLLNTRLVNGNKIIISTNCSDEELQKKYTPQIYSRIKGEFLRLPFVGRDIRLIRKGV